jgi:hypothetical protein
MQVPVGNFLAPEAEAERGRGARVKISLGRIRICITHKAPCRYSTAQTDTKVNARGLPIAPAGQLLLIPHCALRHVAMILLQRTVYRAGALII